MLIYYKALTHKEGGYMLVKICKIMTITSLILAFNTSAVQISECMSDECITYFKSFKKASNRGHSNAIYNLAKFYHYGFGTEIDKARALKFYKKAGIHGVRAAEYKAGMLLLTEEQLYDFDEGIKWLKRASRKGQPNAAFLLGQSYLSKQRYSEADIWLTMVYKTHPTKIVRWIKKSQQTEAFNAHNLPSLHQALAETPIENFEILKAASSSNIEVITITGRHRNTALDAMLAGFRKRITSTGTRLPNITCDQNVACNKKTLNVMKDSIWVSQK
ncbi:hypothetical protein DBO93_04880 [Colwellia sp. Arc7-D]|nr:hypothetical protein DBO93_04880 [Colwellia sp. Arc7-D]